MNKETCPWCDGDIEIELGFDNLGHVIACPHCGRSCEVNGDYSDAGESSWWFSLTTTDEPPTHLIRRNP